MRVYD